MADLLQYHPKQNLRILVFALNDFSLVKEFETDAGNMVHFGNAWQELNDNNDDTIVMDAMYIDNFDANETLKDVFNQEHAGGGEYRRYHLNMSNSKVSYTKLTDNLSEFPTYNRKFTGNKTQYGYSAVSFDNGADTFFNAIQRVSEDKASNQLRVLPKGLYGSEPLFINTGDKEEQGYILELVYNGIIHKSELHILDPMDLERAYAVIKMDHHIPHQFHGNFVGKVFV